MKTIPIQYKGAQSTTRYSIRRHSIPSARALFDNARRNLLRVNEWHTLAGMHSAVFEIVNEKGEKIDDEVKKGNYLRIKIPAAPGSTTGHGFDWVRVEHIKEKRKRRYQYISMSVRPAPAPIDNNAEVAHFFAPDATSTFCIERRDCMVVASVNGRNEVPNTNTVSIWTRIRNFLIALLAMFGLNKPQWSGLVKGLVKKRLAY